MRTFISLMTAVATWTGNAIADAPKECACKTFTIQGHLPKNAAALIETDPDDLKSVRAGDRPSIRIDLGEHGYPSQELYLRFTRTGGRAWQSELFFADPVTSPGETPKRLFTPLAFSDAGARENGLCSEIRPSEVTEATFGDRLYLCFDGLEEKDAGTPLSVRPIEIVSCPCFEFAKTVVGEEELRDPESKYRTRYYSAEEGFAAMLKDVKPTDDR